MSRKRYFRPSYFIGGPLGALLAMGYGCTWWQALIGAVASVLVFWFAEWIVP